MLCVVSFTVFCLLDIKTDIIRPEQTNRHIELDILKDFFMKYIFLFLIPWYIYAPQDLHEAISFSVNFVSGDHCHGNLISISQFCVIL